MYKEEDDDPLLCGNVTGARHCPVTHTCLCVGDNPNHGYTSFDNFLWSMLTTFQLITLDYWENVYNMVSVCVSGGGVVWQQVCQPINCVTGAFKSFGTVPESYLSIHGIHYFQMPPSYTNRA